MIRSEQKMSTKFLLCHVVGRQATALSLPLVIQLFTCVLALASGPTDTPSHQHDTPVTGSGIWEGSPEGKAYSEFNHHLAGWSVILIGLSEMLGSKTSPFLGRARFLLPLSMLGAGGYLLVWSDHDAWPIGPRSFAETLFSPDWETTQHKIYAILLVGVGSIELVRRCSAARLRHRRRANVVSAQPWSPSVGPHYHLSSYGDGHHGGRCRHL
jgi:hypothetical protein